MNIKIKDGKLVSTEEMTNPKFKVGDIVKWDLLDGDYTIDRIDGITNGIYYITVLSQCIDGDTTIDGRDTAFNIGGYLIEEYIENYDERGAAKLAADMMLKKQFDAE